MSSRLYLTLPLLPNETASSFASRLAVRNKVPNLQVFCAELGLSYTSLRLGKDDVLFQLSKLSGAPFEDLRTQSIKYTGHKAYQIGQVTARSLYSRQNVFRYCQKCLAEDHASGVPYHSRTLWEYDVIKCCHRHKCFLDEAPSGRSVDFVQLCKQHLQSNRVETLLNVGTSDLLLERYLIKRVNVVSTGSWFDDIPVNAVKSFCEYFGVLTLFGPNTKKKDLSAHDWLRAGAHGFSILHKDKRNFRKTVEDFKSLDAFRIDRRRDDFGVFADWLHDQKKNAEFEFARKLFRDFLLDTYPLAAGTRVYGVPLAERRLHTIVSAIQDENLEGAIFRMHLIETGFAEIKAGSRLVKQIKKIRVDDIPKMKFEMGKLLWINQAADKLNISARQLRDLQANGFIKFFGSGVGTSRLYHIDDLTRFSDHLKLASTSVAELPSDAICFARAARDFSVPQGTLLKRIFSNTAGTVLYRGNSCTLYDLYFNRSELNAQLSPPSKDGVLLSDLGETLSLNRTAIACLIKRGMFQVSHETKSMGCIKKKSICPKSIKKFDNEYVSLKALQKERNVPLMSLARQIKKQKIKPLIDSPHASKIYRRSVFGVTDSVS